MTIYVHNPPEPHAVPTQPVIDVTFGSFVLNDLVSGRCGFCGACPKIWLLDIQQLTLGDSSPNPWFGKHYLRKQRYQDVPSPVCRWASQSDEGLPNANPFPGWRLQWEPFVSDQGLDGFGWSLYSPSVDEVGDAVNPSRWLFNGDQFQGYRCLQPNEFTLRDPGAFPFHPTSLSLFPYHP